MTPALALAVLLAGSVRAADAPAYETVSRRVILPASFIPVTPPGAAVVPLALVAEEGSGWDAPGALEPVLGKASAILARCGLTLGAAELLTTRWSPPVLAALAHEDPYKGPAQIAVMRAAGIPAGRPAGFLFSAASIPSTAKAFNKSSVDAFARTFPDAALLQDTFWVTRDQEARPRRRDEQASYSVVAHELVHLLGDLDHTDAAPNLMTRSDAPGAKSGDLDASQCAALRARR